ncbi:MAG TPA: tetratricopeptide repeat protein [Bacteroidia bacterium]|nr:tetratricopeptide repeat protein [Bacteroidia bacterium]
MGINKTAKKKNIHPQAKTPVSKKTVQQKKSFKEWYWLTGILALTFIVFFPTLDNALTNWDDPTYLNENPLIKQLNAASIKRIFTEIYFGNYQPLHIFSYAVEYHFYQLNPHGYHATSVVMHLIATGLVCWFIWLLTENSFIALITALLFGIHPLHVESVAWAAERKDLLYANFFLASLIAYIRYVKSAQKIKYMVYALLFFVLSIMSKTMAASLPPVIILLDYYFSRKLNAKVVMEKIPFFLIAIGFGLYSIHASSTTGSISTHVFNLFQRILIANFNLLAYVVKLLIPIKLSAFYPYPENALRNFPFYFYITPFIVIGLLFLIIRSIKKTKAFFFAAGFFVACIFLVLQLLPVGPAMMSERYSYLPSIAFFYVIAYVLQQLIQNRSLLKTPVYVGLSAYSLFLCIATFNRSDVWQNSMSLWTNVIEQFPHAGIALNNRGNVYGKEMGQLDKAMENFNQSIQFDPGYENAYANRGIVYCMRGQFDLGIKDFNKALELQPDYFEALVNRGIAYAQTKQFDKAIADFTKLTGIKKDDPAVYLNRGVAYTQSARYNEAITDFNKALSLSPSYAEAFYRRSTAFYNNKQYKEALGDVQKAAALGFKVEDNYLNTIQQAAEKN